MSGSPYEKYFESDVSGEEGYDLGSVSSVQSELEHISRSSSPLSPEAEIDKGVAELETVKKIVKKINKESPKRKSLTPEITEKHTIIYRNGKAIENPSEFREGDFVVMPTGIRFVHLKTERIKPKVTAKSEWIIEQSERFAKEGLNVDKIKKELEKTWKKLPKDEKDKYKKKAQVAKDRLRMKRNINFINRNILTETGKRVPQPVELEKLSVDELKQYVPEDETKKMNKSELLKYILGNSEKQEFEVDYDFEKVDALKDPRQQAILMRILKGLKKGKKTQKIEAVSEKGGLSPIPEGAKKEAIVEVAVAKKASENMAVRYTGVYRYLVGRTKSVRMEDEKGNVSQKVVYNEIPFKSAVIFDEAKYAKTRKDLVELVKKYSKSKTKGKSEISLKYILAGSKRKIQVIKDGGIGLAVKEQVKLAKTGRELRAIIDNFDLPIDRSETDEVIRKKLKKLARKLIKSSGEEKKLLRNGVPVPGSQPLQQGEIYEVEYIPERKVREGVLVPVDIERVAPKGYADIVKVMITNRPTQGPKITDFKAGDKITIRHKRRGFNGQVIQTVGTRYIISGIYIENFEVFATLPMEEKKKAPIIVLTITLNKDSFGIDGQYFGHYLGDITNRTALTLDVRSLFVPFARERDYEPHLIERHRIAMRQYGAVDYDEHGEMVPKNFLYPGKTKFIPPQELKLSRSSLKVRTLSDILNSKGIDNVLINAVHLSLVRDIYSLLGRVKEVDNGIQLLESSSVDNMISNLEKSLLEKYGKSLKSYVRKFALLSVFLTNNIIGKHAKIFKAKVRSGLYSVSNLAEAKLFHLLPELYMNTSLKGKDLQDAEDDINGYVKNVYETFLENVYGLRIQKRGGNFNISKYMSKKDICKTIDGKPVDDGTTIICEQDGQFYCLSVEQVLTIVDESEKKGIPALNPLTGKAFSKDFIDKLHKRYALEMKSMKDLVLTKSEANEEFKKDVKKEEQQIKRFRRAHKGMMKRLSHRPSRERVSLTYKQKKKLYRKAVKQEGLEFGTYNDADIALISEITGLSRKDQTEIKRKEGFPRFESVNKEKTIQEARKSLSPATRKAIQSEVNILAKTGYTQPPVKELREMAKEIAKELGTPQKTYKRPVKRTKKVKKSKSKVSSKAKSPSKTKSKSRKSSPKKKSRSSSEMMISELL